MRVKLPGNSAYAAICIASAALAWFAAGRASAVRLEALRSGGFAWDEAVSYTHLTLPTTPYV